MREDDFDRDPEVLWDASWLAGTSEFSATGGGSQPVHGPQASRPPGSSEDAELPEGDSLRELYRYSLERSTQDPGRREITEWWEDAALHVEDGKRRAGR